MILHNFLYGHDKGYTKSIDRYLTVSILLRIPKRTLKVGILNETYAKVSIQYIGYFTDNSASRVKFLLEYNA